jgi:hypothetical protein
VAVTDFVCASLCRMLRLTVLGLDTLNLAALLVLPLLIFLTEYYLSWGTRKSPQPRESQTWLILWQNLLVLVSTIRVAWMLQMTTPRPSYTPPNILLLSSHLSLTSSSPKRLPLATALTLLTLTVFVWVEGTQEVLWSRRCKPRGGFNGGRFTEGLCVCVISAT